MNYKTDETCGSASPPCGVREGAFAAPCVARALRRATRRRATAGRRLRRSAPVVLFDEIEEAPPS